MKHSILTISGWAFGESVWSRLQKELQQASEHELSFAHLSWSVNNPKLPIENPIIMAWSLGTLIALDVAMIQNIKHLFLFSPTARFLEDDNYAGTPNVALRSMILKLKKQKDTVIDDFLNTVYPKVDVNRKAQLREEANGFNLTELTDGLNHLKDTDLRLKLSSIQCPITIFHGQYDSLIPPSQGQYIYESLSKNSTLTLVPFGHDLLEYSHDIIVSKILEVLNNISP